MSVVILEGTKYTIKVSVPEITILIATIAIDGKLILVT